MGLEASDRASALAHARPVAWPRPRTLGWQVVAGVAVVPLAASAAFLALTGEHVATPAATAAYRAYLVAVSMLVGLVWCRRRPRSRFGPLLVLFGVAWWIVSLEGSESPVLYTLGICGEPIVFALTFILCLTFPQGRVTTRFERLIVAVTFVVVPVLMLPVLLFDPMIEGAGVLSGCAGPCPGNPFAIADEPLVRELARAGRTVIILALSVAVVVAFLSRLRSASRPRRRALLAVALGSLTLLPMFVAYQLARRVLELDAATLEALEWPLVAARMLFGLGFLIALLQSELFAAAALRRLLAQLAARPSLRGWRAAVADALDDPSLRIGYRIDGVLREADGGELRARDADAGRLWVPVERDGRPLAAIETDAVLAEEPELVRAVSEATLLAVENGHLESDLQAARARIVDAGDAQRRQLARDLHDGAQQRLVALRVHLGLARDVLDAHPDADDLLRRLGGELDDALADLRAIVRGVYPPVLGRDGIPEALRSIAAVATLPVTVEADGVGRYDEPVESTVYFCCVEAIQNAVKYAGPDASVRVGIAASPGRLRFAVEDDGVGFDPDRVAGGLGFANLADRVGALGGTVEVGSRPGRGTCVRGSVPV